MEMFMRERFSATQVIVVGGNDDCDSAWSGRHDDNEVCSSGHHGHSGIANKSEPGSSPDRGYDNGDDEDEEDEEDEDDHDSSGADNKFKEHTEKTKVVVKEKKKAKRSSGNVSATAAGETVKGLICHWCRQRSGRPHVRCSRCVIKYCARCLLNRNGENIEDESRSDVHWVCPRCRGGCGRDCRNCCNCGPCRKSQGLLPTGLLYHTARDAGFTNVHDYLISLKTGESAEVIARRKNGRGWTCATGAIDLRFIFLWGKKGKRKPTRPRLGFPSSTSTPRLEDDMLCEMTTTGVKAAQLITRAEGEEQVSCTVREKARGPRRSSGEFGGGGEELHGSENKLMSVDAMDCQLSSTNSDRSESSPSTSMTVGGRECRPMPGEILKRKRSLWQSIKADHYLYVEQQTREDMQISLIVQGGCTPPEVNSLVHDISCSLGGEGGSTLIGLNSSARVDAGCTSLDVCTPSKDEAGSTWVDKSSPPKGEGGTTARKICTSPRGKAVSAFLRTGDGSTLHDITSSPRDEGGSAIPHLRSPRGEAGSSLLRSGVRSTLLDVSPSPRVEGGSTLVDIRSSPKGESGSTSLGVCSSPRTEAGSTLLDVTSSPRIEGGGAVLDVCSPRGDAGITLIRAGGGSTLPDALAFPRGKGGNTSLRGEAVSTLLRTGGGGTFLDTTSAPTGILLDLCTSPRGEAGSAVLRPGGRSTSLDMCISTMSEAGSTSLGCKGLRQNLEEPPDLNSSSLCSDVQTDLSRKGQEITGFTSRTKAECQVPSSIESAGVPIRSVTPVPAEAAGATFGQVHLCSPGTIVSSISESPVIFSPKSADSGSSVITKAMLARCETEAATVTTTNNFKTELDHVLQTPHSDKQLRNMWAYFNFHRPTTEEADELRLCEHHLDLCRKLAKAVTPDVKLRLLRGFFFWLLHSNREGAFRPWGAEEIGDDHTGGYNLSSESEVIAQLLACGDN